MFAMDNINFEMEESFILFYNTVSAEQSRGLMMGNFDIRFTDLVLCGSCSFKSH